MRKNDLVKLNPAKCFTEKQGGGLRFPLTNYANDEDGVIEGTRLPSKEDLRVWRESEASKGLDCAGETKLPPTAYRVCMQRDRIYTVLRARCRPVWNYRDQPGMAKLLCTETGHEVYVKREFLEVV